MPENTSSLTQRNLTRTLLSGADITPLSLARSISARLGKPILENLPVFTYTQLSSDELEGHLDVIIRGTTKRYSHPELPGMEFTRKQGYHAISSVIKADRLSMDGDYVPRSIDALTLEIQQNPAFDSAARNGDRVEQLRIALHKLAVHSRQVELIERQTQGDTKSAAVRDVTLARALIDDFRGLKNGTLDGMLASSESITMLNISRSAAFDPNQTSDYELALMVIDGACILPELHEPKQEDFELTFPLPNIASNLELESILNTHFPRSDETGEIERHMFIRLTARTLDNYVKLLANTNGFVERFKQCARAQFGRDDFDQTPHSPYKQAVDTLLQDFSEEKIIELAIELVDRHYEQQRGKFTPILETLNDEEKAIVSQIVGACDVDLLAKFVRMDPGLRDLRVANYLNSLWTQARHRADIATYRHARQILYAKCNLREATTNQKRTAIMQVHELTDFQRDLIASFFKTDTVTNADLVSFSAWACDPAKRQHALDLWKRQTDIFTLASLVNKLRFSQDGHRTNEEIQFLRAFDATLSEGVGDRFNETFVRKTQSDQQHHYRPEVVQVYETFSQQLSHYSLYVAARRQAELHTMLEFLGVAVEKADVTFDYKNCTLYPQIIEKNGERKFKEPCEDCMSSMVITLDDGKKIMIDAVFDGAGGHKAGERASAIAKDVLEIAALAGWLKTPEDVRKAVVIADLTILVEQLAERDPTSLRRTNNMGSTAVIAFQCGEEFYAIHCGDSECRVLRENRIIFKTSSHSLAYEIIRTGKDPESEDYRGLLRSNRNVIISALGSSAPHIDINNDGLVGEVRPIKLEPIDVVALDSDGINDPICADHEYSYFISESNGNLTQARIQITEMASVRSNANKEYPTNCQCGSRPGKSDDKSLILRYAAEGVGFEFFPRLIENPRGFFSSPEFGNLISELVLADRARLEETFDMLIMATERASERKDLAARAATLALFEIISQRSDCDQLVDFLVPRIPGWSNLVMEHLKDSRTTTPDKKVMFDFISKVLDPTALAPLLQARNPDVISWTTAYLKQLPIAERLSLYTGVFEGIETIFHYPNTLNACQTRYLDEMVLGVYGSTLVQDVALRLGIRPRDLEIMAFHVYANLDLDHAINTHNVEYGSNIIANLSTALFGVDAQKILEASYYIYCITNGRVGDEAQKKDMIKRLWAIVEHMDIDAEYYMGFADKAFALRRKSS
ncbi:protein phosphatase 2C domain-containing protein [Candidatus Micrarchaeota archaeon]|nr:protein phosphatase 2C domain-containing protein [Candidatus Micrarchaeota archaeon]